MKSYDNYSLDQLSNWVHDAVCSTDNTPEEIYEVIKNAVKEEYQDFSKRTNRCYKLLQLLSGEKYPSTDVKYDEHMNVHAPLSCDKDDKSPECMKSWSDFWEENYYPEEYYPHPDQKQYTEEEMNAMCEQAASEAEKQKCREYNLREAEYYDKRAKLDMTYNDMIAKGYTMTDDGFWIKEPKQDKVVKWQLPVEAYPSGEYFVTFPDDLLEAADLKEGDTVEWVDRGDGSYLLKKTTKPLSMDEC